MLVPGTVICSRYTIVKTLGRGGMGAVYIARTLDHPDLPAGLGPGQPVAVKQVLSSHLDGHERQRAIQAFEQEACLLARLRHPALVRVFEHLSSQDDRYLIMEYVDGWTLSQVIKRRDSPLPFARVQIITRQLCQVLSYLHGLDPPVIFRDLKPSNIMINRSGNITLIDFGIARVFEDETQTQTYLRGVGSAGYAPLEQYAGGTDPRSDVYSLGATLYTLLTHHIPPPAAVRVVGCEDIKEIEPINREVPIHWCKAVRKMLKLRREERYVSIAQVEAALHPDEDAPDVTTTLLEAPKLVIDLDNALLVQRLGLRRPEVVFNPRKAIYSQREEPVGPADLVFCLKHDRDAQCGINLVVADKERKTKFDLGIDNLAAYLVFEDGKSAPPDTVLPTIRSSLSQFAMLALDQLSSMPASPANLGTLAQLRSVLTVGSAIEQAARLEMNWRQALKTATPQDWARLAGQLRSHNLPAAAEFSEYALQYWMEQAAGLGAADYLQKQRQVLEEMKSMGDDGQLCMDWLATHSKEGRTLCGHDWLALELRWRQAYPTLAPAEQADCLLQLGLYWMDRAEYAKAEPFAKSALDLAERVLGSNSPTLSPYLRLFADVCDHRGMSKQSTEYRTRAL